MSFVSQFKDRASVMTKDLHHRKFIRTALRNYEVVRDKRKAAFQDWQGARQLAAETKWQAVNHLDKHLEEFVSKIEARGTKVHWASNASQARDIILKIVQEKKAKSVIKSKSMTSEEIHLNDALEKAGLVVVESDLGEFIVQLRHEAPYHLVFPSMHLTRGEIRDLFERELGVAAALSPQTVDATPSSRTPTGDGASPSLSATGAPQPRQPRMSDAPEDLTMVARRVMRQKYITADVGITGANFAIAETGMVSITENEGNARLTAALPKTMISLIGIEKVLPKFEDLALFLPMLATMGAGQQITCYNTMYSGPRQPGETDGPEEWHVVLLDNHRTELLADAEQRDALHCIRCGACLNVCPIFRNVGGHTYNTTYGGPVGSVITPHLRGLQDWKHLSGASSLCGACTETCPVKIDLHHHLLHNRRNSVKQKPPLGEKFAFKLFAFGAKRPTLWKFGMEMARLFQPLQKLANRTPLDPVKPWTNSRELPPLAQESFKDWWRKRQ